MFLANKIRGACEKPKIGLEDIKFIDKILKVETNKTLENYL